MTRRRLVNEMVGDFLLELYHQQIISPHNKWNVLKSRAHQKFTEYVMKLQEDKNYRSLANIFKTTGLGSLLRQGNYLIDSPMDSVDFCINNISLLQYRKQKYEKRDEEYRNYKNIAMLNLAPEANASEMLVNENAESFLLTYNGSLSQESNDFQFTNTSCYICKQTFETSDNWKEHIKGHCAESDFKLIKQMQKLSTSILNLCYKHCENPRYFCFTLESLHPNIIIEKILIMQLDSMLSVGDPHLPYQLTPSGQFNFCVDSIIFPIYLQQAIAIVFHDKNKPAIRMVEQHHFICKNTFTVNKFGNNPNCLPNNPKFEVEFPLPQYLPNATVRAAMKKKIKEDYLCQISDDFKDYLTKGKMLTAQNMCKTLYLMLQMEDISAVKELCDLIQRHVKLQQSGREYTLKLRAAHSEFNDNILVANNDIFIIPETTATKSLKMDFFLDFLFKDANEYIITNKKIEKTFYGQVTAINDDELSFTCDEKISLAKSYIIVFRPVRQPIRYQYRALELLSEMSKENVHHFFFPEYKRLKQTRSDIPTASLKLQNENILSNPEHLQAVQQIIGNATKSAPYIIFGPPGTGKTTIVVESVLQLYLHHPNTKILITAGPNSACDEIALRLCKVISTMKPDPRAIARIYCRSQQKLLRGGGKSNVLLLKYSNLYDKHFYPNINVLHEYRIVICTLSAVGKLCTGRFGKDGASVYTHVFVDESAATSEAETLVGIVATLSSNVQLILSGDPKQLGSIIKAQAAKDYGLGVSLMERLLERDCYAVDEQGSYDRSVQIRLHRNFRSHSEIVKLYNHLFYNDKLKAMLANDASVTSLCEKWPRTRESKYPILFHSVSGVSQRKNKSWRNREEVKVVMNYVKDLLNFNLNGKSISQDDIGIISPYKKQYQLIQNQLHEQGWNEIETGAAETFRGKEKTIIIVSFVRSFTRSIVFINDAKRLNVILSRPKSLLILIGHRKTLSTSENFQYIIEECTRNNSIIEEKCDEQMERAAALMNHSRKKKDGKCNASSSTTTKPQQAISNASLESSKGAKPKEAKK